MTDTYLQPAKRGADPMNIITEGRTEQYRMPPGCVSGRAQSCAPPETALLNHTAAPLRSSTATPSIPSGPESRRFDIQYYTRDVVRNAPGSALDSKPLAAAVIADLGLPAAPKVDVGSPGMRNPAVERYDPSGSRSAMTANWAAVAKGLQAGRPTQLPAIGAGRDMSQKMLRGWQMTHSRPGEC